MTGPHDGNELDLTAYLTIQATIKSLEPVTMDGVDTIEPIIYTLGPVVKFGGFYYSVVQIEVDLEKALDWYNENERETEWNENIFESGYWGSPECALVEDGICPYGYLDEVEILYL